MLRFISLFFLLLMVVACAPKNGNLLSNGDKAVSGNPETTVLNPGGDLILRIRQLPGVRVLDRAAQSIVKVDRNDGVYNDSVSPIYLINGKLRNANFNQVYNDVVASGGVSSVRCIKKPSDVARYGLPGGSVIIAVETAK